jgi:hypothetical protein
MQPLEVSGAVQPIEGPLGVKGLKPNVSSTLRFPSGLRALLLTNSSEVSSTDAVEVRHLDVYVQ